MEFGYRVNSNKPIKKMQNKKELDKQIKVEKRENMQNKAIKRNIDKDFSHKKTNNNFIEDMLKNLDEKKVIEGYILHEILGKPKAFRR